MKKARRWLMGVLMLTMLGSAEHGRAQLNANAIDAESEIKTTLYKFLIAFDNLDWPSFRQFFSPDATMFHPSAPNQKRIDSSDKFEKHGRACLRGFRRAQAEVHLHTCIWSPRT